MYLMTIVMRLFSKRSGQKAVIGGLSERVSKVLEGYSRRIAGWLNGKTRSYSPLEWILLMISFFLLSGSYCIYLIVSSIR